MASYRHLSFVAIVGLLCGCGTINSRVAKSYNVEDMVGCGYAYGGVRFDTRAAAPLFSQNPEMPVYGRVISALFLLDLPQSAGFDTLLLPITIPEECLNKVAEESPPSAPPSDRPCENEANESGLDELDESQSQSHGQN